MASDRAPMRWRRAISAMADNPAPNVFLEIIKLHHQPAEKKHGGIAAPTQYQSRENPY